MVVRNLKNGCTHIVHRKMDKVIITNCAHIVVHIWVLCTIGREKAES